MGKGKVEVAESLWNNNELAKNLYVDRDFKRYRCNDLNSWKRGSL